MGIQYMAKVIQFSAWQNDYPGLVINSIHLHNKALPVPGGRTRRTRLSLKVVDRKSQKASECTI